MFYVDWELEGQGREKLVRVGVTGNKHLLILGFRFHA